MTMFDFMVNALYMLFSKKKQCGVACVAASVIIVYGVVCGIANAIRRKQNGRY